MELDLIDLLSPFKLNYKTQKKEKKNTKERDETNSHHWSLRSYLKPSRYYCCYWLFCCVDYNWNHCRIHHHARWSLHRTHRSSYVVNGYTIVWAQAALMQPIVQPPMLKVQVNGTHYVRPPLLELIMELMLWLIRLHLVDLLLADVPLDADCCCHCKFNKWNWRLKKLCKTGFDI